MTAEEKNSVVDHFLLDEEVFGVVVANVNWKKIYGGILWRRTTN